MAIILVDRANGSGKTTTLYAGLKQAQRWQPQYP